MSRKKKHAHHEEEAGEAWLLPYSDLMTLLLAVFIVLFAVSQIDAKKAQDMSERFSETMMDPKYVQSQNSGKPEGTQQESTAPPVTEEQRMEELKEELDEKLVEEHMTSSVSTKIDKRGLVISLNNAMFFEPGSAAIKKEYETTLIGISDLMGNIDNYIRVEGHTDNVPMNSEMYPSNWDLSVARATSVVRLFYGRSGVDPEKLIAVGYGEYRPIADNSTEEGRKKNRRIDIIVLNDKYSDLEKSIIK